MKIEVFNGRVKNRAFLVAGRFARYSVAELGSLGRAAYGAVVQVVADAEEQTANDKETATLFEAIQEDSGAWFGPRATF